LKRSGGTSSGRQGGSITPTPEREMGDSWERDVVTVYSSREKAEAHIKGLDIDEYYGYKLHHFIDEYEVE
jgi:hypothetical protein